MLALGETQSRPGGQRFEAIFVAGEQVRRVVRPALLQPDLGQLGRGHCLVVAAGTRCPQRFLQLLFGAGPVAPQAIHGTARQLAVGQHDRMLLRLALSGS